MVINHLFQTPSFNPEEISSMAQAFEAVCSALQMPKLDDDLARFVAAKIIAAAGTGERNPERLCEIVLTELERRPSWEVLAAARRRDAKPSDTQTQRLEFQQGFNSEAAVIGPTASVPKRSD
jgi:hypothetical protein